MPDDQNEYPPQFASSDLSGLIGQINDFAGVPPPPPPPPAPMALRSAKSASTTTAAVPEDLAKFLSSGEYSLPVTIVGSQAQRGPYLPGLKDVLIAVTYIRLAEQITDPNLKSTAQKFAYELMQTGNSTLTKHISRQAASLRKAK